MAQKELTQKDIRCLGHLKRVFTLLGPLHEVGCERDRAGNRELVADETGEVLNAEKKACA